MMASMAGFIVNDAFFKWVRADLSLFQAIFVRGLMATVLIVALAWYLRCLSYRPQGKDRRLIGLRVVGEVGGTTCYLTALSHLPLANATAILQALPLTVTFAAAWLLGEKVGWRRYSAIVVGLLGVCIIVRPGSEGFDWHALWAIAAVGFLTLRDLTTRRLSPAVPSAFVTLLTSITITTMAGLLLPVSGWNAVSGVHWLALGAAAFCLIFGYLFGVMTMRVGEIGFVSPFRYSILLWAILLGIAVFGEWPDLMTILGAAIVAATGIYSFYRERRLARSPKITASSR